MFKGSFLLPLGVLFLIMGGYSASRHGFNEHVVLLLALGVLNIAWVLGRRLTSR